jgi:hypothetical protein
MQGVDGDGCRCGAVSVGTCGADYGLDHDLGVRAGIGKRFGWPGAPAGAGRRRRPRMRRHQCDRSTAPRRRAAGSRSGGPAGVSPSRSSAVKSEVWTWPARPRRQGAASRSDVWRLQRHRRPRIPPRVVAVVASIGFTGWVGRIVGCSVAPGWRAAEMAQLETPSRGPALALVPRARVGAYRSGRLAPIVGVVARL